MCNKHVAGGSFLAFPLVVRVQGGVFAGGLRDGVEEGSFGASWRGSVDTASGQARVGEGWNVNLASTGAVGRVLDDDVAGIDIGPISPPPV